MTPTTTICVAGWLLAAASQCARGQVVRAADFVPDPTGRDGEERYDRMVEVGREARLPVAITVTVRRNGTLKAANLSLRVLDEYNDGQLYEGGLLHVEFADVTGDDFKDLVITGIVVHTGEKESDPVTREPMTSIYSYAPEKAEFRRVFHIGPEIDMPK